MRRTIRPARAPAAARDDRLWTVHSHAADRDFCNRGVTAALRYTNRPLHMIQEGYDAGVIAGSITDESVIARPAGKVVRYLVAAPG